MMTFRPLLAALLMATCSCVMAQSVTYDFTGVVEDAEGAGTLTSGDQVTGTFTIDYAAAEPAESFGTFGDSATFWNAMNSGGAGYNQPALSSLVFSSTLQGGDYSYSVSPNSYQAISSIFGSPVSYGFTPVLNSSFSGDAQTTDAFGGYSETYIGLLAAGSGESVYNAQGLPVFNSGDSFTGMVFQFSGDGSLDANVNYQITSFSPVSAVPESSTYAAMLIGLGFVAYHRTRRRKFLRDHSTGALAVV